jgi:hypothetical protein
MSFCGRQVFATLTSRSTSSLFLAPSFPAFCASRSSRAKRPASSFAIGDPDASSSRSSIIVYKARSKEKLLTLDYFCGLSQQARAQIFIRSGQIGSIERLFRKPAAPVVLLGPINFKIMPRRIQKIA